MRASQNAIELIKRFEGFRAIAYRCPGGTMTIGYGSTDGVLEGQAVTPAQAQEMLVREVAEVDADLSQLVRVRLSQNQWDALISLVYNIGVGNFEQSTLRKIINQGRFDRVPAEIKRWRLARGRILSGLIARRAAEAALWEGRAIEYSRLADAGRVSSPFAREALTEPGRGAWLSLPLINWILDLFK